MGSQETVESFWRRTQNNISAIEADSRLTYRQKRKLIKEAMDAYEAFKNVVRS